MLLLLGSRPQHRGRYPASTLPTKPTLCSAQAPCSSHHMGAHVDGNGTSGINTHGTIVECTLLVAGDAQRRGQICNIMQRLCSQQDVARRICRSFAVPLFRNIQKYTEETGLLLPVGIFLKMGQVLDLIDNHDRPLNIGSDCHYAGTGKYKNGFTKKQGKRVPKAGVIAEVGVRRVRAERSIFQAEAKGPNASAQAEVNLLGAGAVAQVGIGSTTISAGPLSISAGLEANIGAHLTPQSILDVIDYYDRPGRAYAEGLYAKTNTYAYFFTDKPGQRIPKAVAIAEAGVGRARAEWSIFEAEAKGPNASATAQANILGASAMARAEVGSASASAGPFKLTAGLGVDTGVRVGLGGAEVKLLGTGIKADETGAGVSVLGSGVSCAIM
ncbi:uncharacterized protein LOC118242440 [Electrophorus electricus]|uniref:uncharacterized protein LOC118242440 n=1 Tax=Electrophorus electricus TaxID=8005 RepID=UPI0015CF9517|nr:uncharacterized protein LOC118242440 [Electrophorus electricus]